MPEFQFEIQTGKHRNCVCNNLLGTEGTCTQPRMEDEVESFPNLLIQKKSLPVSGIPTHSSALAPCTGSGLYHLCVLTDILSHFCQRCSANVAPWEACHGCGLILQQFSDCFYRSASSTLWLSDANENVAWFYTGGLGCSVNTKGQWWGQTHVAHSHLQTVMFICLCIYCCPFWQWFHTATGHYWFAKKQ